MIIKEYLNELKTTGHYSWADIATMSGLPEGTIRKIFSGETADPRYETIAKLVAAMGGNMDDMMSDKRKKEIEINSIVSLKESYEIRLQDKEKYIASLLKDKKVLFVTTCVVVGLLILLLAIDVLVGSAGWVRF